MTTEALPELRVDDYALGRPVETIDDAIRQDAILAAIETVVVGRRKALKAWAADRLARPGARVEVADVGVALLTDPKPRAQVVDEDAFRAWALLAHPDRTGTVERLDKAVLEAVLAGDHGDDLAAELRDVIDGIPGALETQVVVEENLATDVAKPSVARELADGRVVDKATGEVIPGIEIRMASSPSPRLTPDKPLVARLADEIVERLAPLHTEES